MEKKDLTKAMRWKIADYLADERLPLINEHCTVVSVKDSFYTRYVKRGIDIIVSLLVLIISFPINLFIGIITFLDVGHPVFFRQTRIGKDEKPFCIIKFRNMRDTKDSNGELLPPEQRITKWGKIARKTSLDELLNFWSILKGDMSLIGPRPLVPEYVGRYNKRHRQRLAVRPGLECPPRETGTHIWTWQEQFENDVWYVEHVSFLTDCKMLINLIKFALDRQSAEARATTRRGIFMGYDLNGNAINLEAVPQEYVDRVILEMAETDVEE